MDVGLAAAAGDQPAVPGERPPDDDGRPMVDRHLRTINLGAVDHHAVLGIRGKRVSDPVRHPLRRRAWRQDQIDVDRNGGRRGNDGRGRLCEERLGGGGKGGPVDPKEFLPCGIQHGDVRERHGLGEHADDEKLVFDVIHTVVSADDLSLVNRADHDRGRAPVALGGSACRQKEGRRREKKNAHLALVSDAGMNITELAPATSSGSRRPHIGARKPPRIPTAETIAQTATTIARYAPRGR